MKFLIVLIVVVVACNGQNAAKWTPFQCRDGIWGPNDERMGEIGACSKTYGTEPGKKNPNCTFYCHAIALGLLNDKGLPTSAIYDKWVKESFPEEHKTLATAHFRDCYEKYGQFLGPNDTDCKNAKLFGDCTWSVQPKLSCPKTKA